MQRDTQTMHGLLTSLAKVDLLSVIESDAMDAAALELFVTDFANLIWERFLLDRLPHLLTKSGMAELQRRLLHGSSFEEVQSYLLEQIPTLSEHLFEHAQVVKLDFLEGHYQKQLDQALEDYNVAEDGKTKAMLDKRITKFTRAHNLLLEQDWEGLKLVFAELS